MPTLLTVIGTRPQYIKYAAMAGKLTAGFHELVVDTGQHYDDTLSAQFKQEFGFGKDFRTLETAGLEGGQRFAAMFAQLDAVIEELRPDALFCFGDTDSTLAAGLAAARRDLPVMHVEAGERSRRADGTRIDGWTVPEESNRIIVDHISSLLLCTNVEAVENCTLESCRGTAVVTGDIMFDLFLRGRDQLPLASDVRSRLGIDDGTYYFSTVHRPINTDDGTRLSMLLAALEDLPHPVLFPLHPRTARRIREHGLEIGKGALRPLPPLSHRDAVALASGAEQVLTDSGGLTREAFFCGVPSTCLDDVTAWHAICRSGWCSLTGADAAAIHASIALPAPTLHDTSLFGDGHAADKIVDAITAFFR